LIIAYEKITVSGVDPSCWPFYVFPASVDQATVLRLLSFFFKWNHGYGSLEVGLVVVWGGWWRKM